MTEIQRIQEKVEYSKNKFSQYLNSLVGLGSKQATTREIELFNIANAYDDGVLRRDELMHLRQSFLELDFDKLVSESKIIYNTTSRQLEYRISTYDFNHDGAINQTDKDAVNHVINFFTNNKNTLTDMLNLAGNKDEIARYNIKSWAITRGLEDGTTEHDAFVTKFFDQFYLNPAVKAPIEMLAKVLNLYDRGLGKENLDDLNDYVLMLKENQPLRLLIDLYRFESSEAFNVPDSEKQAMKDRIIAALLDNNVPERQKLVADSIAQRRISIVGDPLTAESLSNFIDRTSSKNDIAKMRIESIAKQLGLENLQSRTDDEYDLFINKFYNEFYISEEKGLDMADITSLARLYSRLKLIKGEEFKLDDLDVYSYAVNNTSGAKFYNGDLNLLLNLDRKAEEFELTPAIRDATMKNYVDIITGSDASDKKIRELLKQALKTGFIPLTKEPLTINKLNDFLTLAADDDRYLDLIITKIANSRDIFDNTANSNDEFDNFKSNFTDYAKYFSKTEQTNSLNFLASLYDGVKIDFNQLDILAIALKNKASKLDVQMLATLYKTDKFNIVDKAEKFREYAEILSGANKDKKSMLSGFLRAGVIPLSPIKKEDVTIRDLDASLAKLDEEGGMLELRIKQLARRVGIDESENLGEFNNFVTTMTSWHNDKNIRFQDLNMLAGFYKNSNKDLSDLSLYANALEKKVSSTEISILFQFENSDKFDLIGAGRDAKIQSYLDILSKEIETDADKERKSILINSIRANKIYLTGEELTIDSLDDIMARTTTVDEIFDIQSDLWAKRLDYPVGSGKYNGFKDSVFALKNENLNSNAITRSLSFLQNFPELSFNDFEAVAQSLSKSRKITTSLHKVVQFVQGETFSTSATSSTYKTEKLNQYIDILERGSSIERTVLNSAIKYNKITLTGKDTSAANLEQALNIAKSEDDYHLQEVKNIADTLGYNVGSSDYVNFKRKFYDELYVEKKMSLSELRYLAGYFSRAVFSNTAFSELVEARRQNISTKALRNLERFANVSDMPQDEVIAYLQIMRGVQGISKQQFLTQVFSSNFIPIANTKLF